jgi:hypothetical protein
VIQFLHLDDPERSSVLSFNIVHDKCWKRRNSFIQKHPVISSILRFKIVESANFKTFEDNGIGRIIHVICPVCGEIEDITDYGLW